MPSTDFGAVRVYTWHPGADLIPTPGTLFRTTGGTGYLVAAVRASTHSGEALGTLRITVVVVNLDDPRLADLPVREWRWVPASPRTDTEQDTYAWGESR